MSAPVRVLRHQADCCRQLAHEAHANGVRLMLIEMADEYDQRARSTGSEAIRRQIVDAGGWRR
jgi:hypothetical protein